MDNQTPLTVFWFRRDLRLLDNHGLMHALKSGHPVLPVFIFDPDILDQLENKLDKRVNFIYQSLQKINNELKEYGSALLVLYQKPLEAYAQLIKDYTVSQVIANHDYEPYAIKRDKAVADFLMANGIPMLTYKDQVMFEKQEVLKPDQSPYTIFTPYSKVWKQKLKELASVPDYSAKKLFSHFHQLKVKAIPTLAEIGFNQTGSIHLPHEPNLNIVANYDATRNFPAVEGTTHMSVGLRFGTVSVRRLVKNAMALNEQWLNELIWREFFMAILFHFPEVLTQSFKPKYDQIKWRNNEAEFDKWCKGLTGYPLVDAGMRELNQTGLMHNRVRMVVASFLTKHLLIDWRWGEAYFANTLLDFDLSANNGNWQWAAGCGCDAAPYFRIFNPTEQAKKFDPQQLYIKKWIPELNDLDYPMPMVDHQMARQRALATFKLALQP